MPARTTSVTLLGDTSDLQAALERAGIVAGDMSAKIRGSAASAGAAAAELAKMTGASATEQADAAGRAAAAYSEMAATITRTQKAAGDAAAKAARAVGASVDEQRAAYTRAIASQRAMEDAQKQAAAAAEVAAEKIGGSAQAAGRAAAELAAQVGRSADEQAAAAGRAAAAFTEQAAKMSSAQKAAGDAAAEAAQRVGASLDEQTAAYGRAVAATGRYEAAQKSAADAAEASARRQKEARGSLAGLGGKLALGATVGGALSGYESVKGAVNLQQQMERLHTQAGVSQSAITPLTSGVLHLAGQVGEGPQTLAEGAYHVASQTNKMLQGLPQAQQMAKQLQILKVAAEGARVGGADLVDTTNALGAALVSGIKGVQNYGQAMGAMNATVGAGDMTMQNLAEAFGTGVVVQAKEAGVSIKQLGGALAVLGDNNIRGATAGRLMASAMRIMKAPSDAAAKALASIGLKSTSLASAMRSGGIVGALQDLEQHLKAAGADANGTTAEMNRAGLIITRAFGGRQSTGIQDLIGQMSRLKASTHDVGSGMHTFGADVRANNQTMAQQFADLKSHVQALGDEFGTYLIPKLEAVAHETQDVVAWMKQHEAAAQALATVIAGVLGTALAAFAYTKAVAFVNATKNMLGAIGSFAKGAASAAQAIAAKLGLISTTSEATAGTVAKSSAGMEGSMTAVGTSAVAAEGEFAGAGEGMVASADATEAGVDTAMSSTGVGAILVGVGLAATEMGTHWGTVMSAMTTAVNAMVKAAESALNGLISGLNWAIGIFNSSVGKLTGDIGKVGQVGVGNVLGGGRYGPGAGLTARQEARMSGFATGKGSNESATYGGHRLVDMPGGFAMAASGPVWQQIASALHNQGFSNTAIAGILGNFAQENGGNTVQGISTNAGPGGIGFAQWTGSRATAEQQFAKSHNESSTSVGAEIGYLLQELRGGYHNAYKAVAAASTPAQAAEEFERIFEGAGIPMMSHRVTNANEAYRLLTGTSASGSTGGARVHIPEAPSLKKYLATGGSTSLAAATSTIPAAVATMLATAHSLLGTKYTWGGGHSGWDPVAELKKIGLDCSGFVSQVLHAGGVSLPGPLNTGGLATTLRPGAGKDVTVFDRPTGSQAHTFMEILGHYFMEGGGQNPTGSVEEMTHTQVEKELAGGGFKEFHPVYSGKMASEAMLKRLGLSGSSGTSFDSTQELLTEAAQMRQKRREELAALGKAGPISESNILGDVGRMSQTLAKAGRGGDTALTHLFATVPEHIRSQVAQLSLKLSGELGRDQLKAATKTAADLTALSKSAGDTMKAVNKAWTAYLKNLSTTGTSILSTLTNAAQSGTVRTLEKDLGVSTLGTSPLIHRAISGLGDNATTRQITSSLSPILTHNAPISSVEYRTIQAETARSHRASLHAIHTSGMSHARQLAATHHLNAQDQKWLAEAHTAATKGSTTSGQQSFDKLIASLKQAHTAALTKLATELVQAHKQALAALAQELYAQQLQKDAESITLQATQTKDQTQKASDVAAAQLNVQKAIEQAQSDAATSATTIQAAVAQQQQDAIDAQTAAVQNMTQIIQDRWSAAAQALQDQQQGINDAASAAAQAVNDQSQTQVDLFGERGLYGLNLIAQQLQVQLDQQKGADDQKIALAQQNLDQVTAQWHAQEAAAQLNVDQVTLQQQALAAAAQQAADTIAVVEAQRVAAATQHSDTVGVTQAQKVATATAHADSVQLSQDVAVQLAQTAVDLGANAPKATQDKLTAQLTMAQAQADKRESVAASALTNVTNAANAAMDAASANATAVSNEAAAANAAASANATAASNYANAVIASADATLQSVTGQANYAIQTAQGTLDNVTNAATLSEAALQGKVNVTSAEASTQYAGSGTVVNVYGIPATNAAAIGDAVSWVARTQLQSA